MKPSPTLQKLIDHLTLKIGQEAYTAARAESLVWQKKPASPA